jgi:DNA repair photolyase
MTDALMNRAIKGRGAIGNKSGRFEAFERELIDDGWGNQEHEQERPKTTLSIDRSRTVISFNKSPDLPFDRSINPYRGCEHGCVYCYARPSHAFLGLSPGLDFESRIFYKADAAGCLRAELARPGYDCAPIVLGANTDAYQPSERALGITRAIVEQLASCDHPLRIITKSSLVERDMDLLAPMAERGLCVVAVSITSLDTAITRRMEPRAASPARRLQTVERLSRAGIPVEVPIAPVIPVLTDGELEQILARVRAAGASDAWYTLIRLPREVAELFNTWIHEHFPLKADHVMQRIRDSRGGKDYESAFGTRMRGRGTYADLLERRFRLAYRRLGFPGTDALDLTRFRPPAKKSGQLELF